METTSSLSSIRCSLHRSTLSLGWNPSLKLYNVAIRYTSETVAAATTTTIPAITFVMPVLLRMESISIKQWHGVSKVLGSVTSLSGVLVFALVKGAPLKIMNWFPEIVHHQIHQKPHYSGEWIKGSLIMLSANTTWSLWLIWQGSIVKEYPAKLRLTALQCFFSLQGCRRSMESPLNISNSISFDF